MGGVFISYRRGDSRGSAGRLYDDLSDRFGRDLIFRDLDAIQPGAVYGKIIDRAIAGCDVLIAVIGNNWIEARDPDGRRRVDSPKDLVRIEITTALAQDKIVIPVLVEDARMPGEGDLPADLAPLASRNALPISDHRWDYDVGRLVAMLDDLVGPARAKSPVATGAEPAEPAADPAVPAAPEPPTGSKRTIPVLALIVLALVAAAAFAAGRKSGGEPRPQTDVSTAGQGALPTRSELQSNSPAAPPSEDPKGAIPIAVGDTVDNGKPPGAGNIASPGAKQRYTFAGTAGQILFLRSLYKGPYGDLEWQLLAPSGTRLAGGHSMGADIGRVTLSANGTHTIEVSGSGVGTGTYGFVVTAVPADASFAISVGDTVENGKPAGAGNIASSGAKQRYTFAGTAGQILFLKSLYKGPYGELEWQLLAPSGTRLAGGHSMGADIGRVTLSANGTHTIEVSGSGVGTGTYGFVVTAVP